MTRGDAIRAAMDRFDDGGFLVLLRRRVARRSVGRSPAASRNRRPILRTPSRSRPFSPDAEMRCCPEISMFTLPKVAEVPHRPSSGCILDPMPVHGRAAAWGRFRAHELVDRRHSAVACLAWKG